VAGKYIDAAQALAALDRTPVVLQGFQGRDWELFSAMPAKPVFNLMLLEAQGRAQEDLRRGEVLAMMSEMVPAEVFQAWLDGGMTMAEATALLSRVIAVYNGEDAAASAEGEASGPEAGPTPASNTGPR
jgi:hypothetical protein